MILANVQIDYSNEVAHRAFVDDLHSSGLTLLGDGHPPHDDSTDLEFEGDDVAATYAALAALQRAHPLVLREITFVDGSS